jgi:hypothetical protein
LRRAGKRSTESRNRFQANVALMRSLASMPAKMSRQMLRTQKRFLARSTYVWCDEHVSSRVQSQIALLRKRFITHSAFERLLASMPAKMSRQMLRTQKRFIARSTYVWCDEHVSSRVTFQSAFITIRFITHFAFERPLASMILSLFFHLFLLFHL